MTFEEFLRSLTSDDVLIERQTTANSYLTPVAIWGANECRATRVY
jgi:hypothetical protein